MSEPELAGKAVIKTRIGLYISSVPDLTEFAERAGLAPIPPGTSGEWAVVLQDARGNRYDGRALLAAGERALRE